MPIALGNDANMAALGEWKFGAGRGYKHLIYITDQHRHWRRGHRRRPPAARAPGSGGEIGHITVLPDGPLCGCGIAGHLEALASGTAIARYVADQLASGVPSTSPRLHVSHRPRCQPGRRTRRPAGKSAALRAPAPIWGMPSPISCTSTTRRSSSSAGVSHAAGAHFMEPVRASVADRVMSQEYLHGLVITTAALGDDAGLMGASALRNRWTQKS